MHFEWEQSTGGEVIEDFFALAENAEVADQRRALTSVGLRCSTKQEPGHSESTSGSW